MFEGCNECKHNSKGKKHYPCNECIHNAQDRFERRKPRSNADKIRSMSDEELQAMLEKVRFCGGLLRTEESSAQCRGCKDPWCCDIGGWLRGAENG